MNKTIFGLTLFAVASSVSTAASAATYYISDCQTGAYVNCAPGNDSNAGTAAAPWRTTANILRNFGNLNGGDKLLFAQGGAWSNAGMTLQSLRSTAANPIVFDSYAPSWGGTAKPILREARSGYTMFAFTNGGTPVADAGYQIQNLDLRGEGVAETGIFTSGLTSDITINNVTIDGFRLGLYCGTAIERIKLLNSTLRNNSSQGVLTECANSVIEGNTFDNNGFGQAVYDHTIYVNSDYGGAKNMVIRNNTLLNNSIIGGVCQSSPLVVHGLVDGLLIENNRVIQAANTSTTGCWGIAVDAGYGTAESFAKIVIRANTLVNMGGMGIGCSSCIAPVIEDNVIVMDAGPELIGIAVPDRPRGPGDAVDTGAIIRNNSIYFANTAADSQGIALASRVGSTAGSNLQVVSNLIVFASGSNSHQCFDTAGTSLVNYVAFNNNLCYHATGGGAYSTTYSALTNAKAAGFDSAGLSVNPKLAAAPTRANGWSMALASDSPAINAGHATLSSPVDKLLSMTRSAPDIGAFEFSAGVDRTPPAAPSSVIVQ